MTAPYWEDDAVALYLGDCLDVLRTLPDASVDAVVTDPPAGISFMGRDWDGDLGGRDRWIAWHADRLAEAARVLKPGGHALVWALPRTSHWTAMAVEDAGLEIRDCVTHLFGSGFPKSLDVSKAIDKRRDDRAAVKQVAAFLKTATDRAGLTAVDLDAAFGFAGNMAGQWLTQANWVLLPRWEQWLKLRELLGFGDEMDAEVWRLNGRKGMPGNPRADRVVTAPDAGAVYQPVQNVRAAGTPVLEAAARWQGWGTALKPAAEHWWLARRPLAGTVAANVLEHGTGALNIDACRTEAGQDYRDKCASVVGLDSNRNGDAYGDWRGARTDSAHQAGRWPTNVVLSHPPLVVDGEVVGDACASGCVDGCPARELDRQSGIGKTNRPGSRGGNRNLAYGMGQQDDLPYYADEGGASRFFPTFRYEAKAPASERPKLPDGTAHTTVKPLSLMRWLIRLVTPPKVSILICSGCGKEVRGVRRDVQAEAVGTDSVFSHVSPEEGGACAEGSTETVPNMREGADRGKGPEVLQSGVLRTGSAEAEDVHDLWHRIPCSQTNASDLLTSMCREGDDAASAGVRVVRREVPAQDEQDEILQSNLQRQGERTCETEAIPGDGEGLPGAVSAGSSNVESAGIRAGASQGDGRSPGTDASPDGGGASPQRDQGRQPRREPSSAIEAGARPHSETATETDRVPSLSRTDRSLGTCPDCCAPLELSEGPGVVLDPFAGSGTTGEAAVVEGFRAVLIEREAPYAELIKTRLAKPIAPVLGFEGELT